MPPLSPPHPTPNNAHTQTLAHSPFHLRHLMWQLFDLGNFSVVMIHDPIIWTSLQKKWARIISEGRYAIRTKDYDLIGFHRLCRMEGRCGGIRFSIEWWERVGLGFFPRMTLSRRLPDRRMHATLDPTSVSMEHNPAHNLKVHRLSPMRLLLTFGLAVPNSSKLFSAFFASFPYASAV